MNKRLVGYILLANIILSILVPITLSKDEAPWWNESWSFREEISIPIDTSSEHAHYQPFDIHIDFDNPCWAKDEEEHSVRVIFQDGGRFKGLESQIYELNYTDENYINECNLVFLIPKEANGKEKYYVYYDDGEKLGPNYQNRVDIDESYYWYEPIQGLSFESWYYKITEEDYIVYAIAQDGTAMDSPVSQQVTKLKSKSENVLPKNNEQVASFNFNYFYGKRGEWTYISTSERLISKQIFIDGNLMVKFGIVSQSADGLFQTTVIYKYYYCPTEDKRIYAHVKHETVNYPLPHGDEIGAFYMMINCGGMKSSTIEDLNFGRIPPYLHLYGEEERVLTYDMDPYPENIKWQKVIGKTDNCDLGSRAWVSVDDGESGEAHAIILDSPNVLKSGSDERDGIEIHLFELNHIKLPGVDGHLAYVYMMRNAYEPGEAQDEELPEDFVVEFDAEFFSTENGGYKTVEEEAIMYQSLVKYQPTSDEQVTDEDTEEEMYSLTAFVHLAPSFPMGAVLSASTGKNLSYICAELYRDEKFISSEIGGRLPIKSLPSLDNITPMEKIKLALNIFDWKNLSFFKKIRFQNLQPGRYLVKVWRENPLFVNKREFIGLQVIDIQKDMETHIFCSLEGRINISVLNQHGTGVENTQVCLMKDEMIIAENRSGSNGKATIGAPCSLRDKYTLNVVYKGFLVSESEEGIQLGYIRWVLPLEETVNFDIHNLTIKIRDAQDDAPAFDVDMALTSDEMEYTTLIPAEKVSNEEYRFTDLYPANYTLRINYKSFEIEETINISETMSMTIDLHDLTVNVTDTWSLPPEVNLDIVLTSKEYKKSVVIPGERLSAEEYLFTDLYPANYTLRINYKSFTVEESVYIPYENGEALAVVFPAVFNITTTILDSHGNPLKDAKILMMRGGKNQTGFTDDNGNAVFLIPPGNYVTMVYSNSDLVAQRRVDVLNEKKYTVVTTEEPLLPIITIASTVIILIGVAFLSYRKKDTLFFFKILAVSLAIIAIVSPWWAINGSSSSPHFETSTNMFLMPTEMVTITSNTNVTAGELASLDERFTSVIDLLPTLMTVGFICIILSIILDRYSKRRLSLLVFFLAIVIFVGSIVIFSYAMSELAKVGVGSFIGNGNLDVHIPGEKMYETLSCNWGPSLGFYLLLISTVVLAFVAILKPKKLY